MYLEGTLHIALFYLILGLAFGVLPYMFGWWRELTTYLNKFELNSQSSFRNISIFLLMVIIVLITATYHSFLFFPGAQRNQLLISATLFWVLPLSASFSGVIFLVWHRFKTKLGDFFILSIIFSGLGLAASNIHDVLWCARATKFFTRFNPGWGIYTWVNVFNSPTNDYRVFGTYMLIQTILFLLIAHSAYFSLTKKLEEKTVPLLWGWAGVILLGAGITVLDWPWFLNPPLFHTMVETILILLSVPAFYKSGIGISEILSRR